MLKGEQIEKNIDRLLSNASAPVRYLTHKYLLGNDVDSKLMRDLWLEIENSPETLEIFSK